MTQQTTFLGATVSKFTTGIGWGEQPSTLTCTLVEDRTNGDSFNPPAPGQPCQFIIGEWSFEGILEKYSKEGSSGGSPIYTVNLVDPREILSGTQLILNSYTGYSNIPNVLNIYGFLEDGNFGGSKINTAGIPWYLIANSIVSLTDNVFTPGDSYGGGIHFQGFTYTLDLTELPSPDRNYRISNDIMSVMDFITDICEATGHSYFFSLTGNSIKLWTVDRSQQPVIGAISSFISNTTGAVSKGIGMEMRNETTSKMILGADLHQLYGANPYPNGTDYDSIWPYVGLFDNGNVNIPRWNKHPAAIKALRNTNTRKGLASIYKYQDYREAIFDGDMAWDLDSRDVDVIGVGSTYTTDQEELYTAQEGVDTWRSFLDLRNSAQYKPALDVINKHFKIFISPFYRIGRMPIGHDEIEVELSTLIKMKLHHLKDEIPSKMVVLDPDYPKVLTKVWIIRTVKYGPKGIIPVLTIAFQTLLSPRFCLLDFGRFEQGLKQLKKAEKALERKKKTRIQVGYKKPKKQLISDLDVFIGYKNNHIPNVHFMKAGLLGISTNQGFRLLQSAIHGDRPMEEANPLSNSTFDKTNEDQSSLKYFRDNNIQRLFNFVSQEANKLGRQFSVSLPFITSVYDGEAEEVRTNYNIAEGGYLPENEYLSALENALIPSNPHRFVLEDKRYIAYARYNLKKISGPVEGKKPLIVSRELDFAELSTDDIFVSPDKSYLFVKCTIQPKFVYKDATTGHSARCVVEMPSSVRNGENTVVQNIDYLFQIFEDINEEHIKQHFTGVGNDVNSEPLKSTAVVPDLIVVPLRNKTQTYGPWHAAGADGKVEVEKDENLAPWNFLTYADMNSTGNAKVQSAVSIQTFDESGDIEFPGLPNIPLGGKLIQGGPYVTNIFVNVASDGVTTRYSMQSWSPRFGERMMSAINRRDRATKRKIKEQDKLLKSLKLLNIDKSYFQQRQFSKSRSKTLKSNSSHHIIAADKNSVVIQPVYNALEQFGHDYEKKAMMSLDGLFAPISFGEQNNDLPSVIIPSGMTDGINALGLYPFRDGTQHEKIVTRGSGVPEEGLSEPSPEYDYRTVGLKGPVWIAGWGKDVDGKPVPSQNISGQILYTDDFSENISGWKAGPLLIGWDEARKGWSAASNTARIVKITDIGDSRSRFFNSGIIYPHVVHGQIYDMVLSSGNALDKKVDFHMRDSGLVNIINFRDNLLVQDTYYLANIIDGEYVIDNQAEWREFV